MSQELATTEQPGALDISTLERVVVHGDLSKLTPAERLSYYRHVCDSLGVNPLTRPFEYIQLNGKLTLYAKRDCTDQLRATRGISVQIVSRERADDLCIVTTRATDRSGRTDESIGAVNLAGLKGEALANALMKAETKGKRRVTLSIVGLGWLDETEVETIADARIPQLSPEEARPQVPPPSDPELQSPQPKINGFEPGRDYSGVITDVIAKDRRLPGSLTINVDEHGPLALYYWSRPEALKTYNDDTGTDPVGERAIVRFVINESKSGQKSRLIETLTILRMDEAEREALRDEGGAQHA